MGFGTRARGVNILVAGSGAFDLTAFAASIIPNPDLTYDLGDASHRWANIFGGTVDANAFAVAGAAMNAANGLVQLDGAGKLPALDGSALTNLDGANLQAASVADAALSANVALLAASNTFSASGNIFAEGLQIGSSTSNDFFRLETALSLAADSPAQITSDQNNYQPNVSGGLLPVYRLSSDASRNITGFTDGNPLAVKVPLVMLINAGTQDIVLKHNSGSSSAGNKFNCSTGADITLTGGQMAFIWRDNTSNVWRVWKLA